MSLEAREHLESCAGCRSLLGSAQISEGRLKELLANVQQSPTWQRMEHSGARETRHLKDALRLLKRSMPTWVPAAAVLLLTFAFTYPVTEPYFKRSGLYVVTKSHRVVEWIKQADEQSQQEQARREQELEQSRQRLAAEFGLYRLAGTLPKDPAEIEKQVDSIKAASAEGFLKEPEPIAAARRNLERKAMAAKKPEDRTRLVNSALELAGAEALVRYEDLRIASSSSPLSVQDLRVSNDGIPTIVIKGGKSINDPVVEELMRESFEKTQGIRGLDIYQNNVLVSHFRRP